MKSSLKFGLISFILYLLGNTISGEDSQPSTQRIRPETIHYVGRTFRNKPSRPTCSSPRLPKKIYYLDTTARSWYDALHICRENGLDLIEFATVQEQKFVIDFLKSFPFKNATDTDNWRAWTGGQALEFRTGPKNITNDQFHWISSGNPFPLNYGGWAPYDPDRQLVNGEFQSCVAVKSNGTLFDYSCDESLYSLCQAEFP